MGSFYNSKPAEWVQRYSRLIPKGGNVLDLACGNGRHTRFLLEEGYRVTAIDKDVSKLNELDSYEGLTKLEFDLEASNLSAKWPVGYKYFDGIVVVNYLYRPLFKDIIEALAANGVLIYQTFAVGNEVYGRPRNSDYLLKKKELLEVFGRVFTTVKFEHNFVDRPSPAIVQRICCVNTR